jgi:ABC-type uncharacterized transport system permease subunit
MLERVRASVGRLASRLVDATIQERLAIAVASTALALLTGLVIVTASGYDPVRFLEDMLYGAFGSGDRFALTLKSTTSFILAGVAVAVAFRAGVFNIGVQGQLVIGGFATAVTIISLAPIFPTGPIGGVLLITAGTLTAVVAGGLYGAFPGLLKAYADANEIITTIMLNFIATGLVFWLIDNFFRPEGTFFVRTAHFPDYATFPSLLFDTASFSIIGIVIALAVAVLVYVFMERTPSGYDMVTSGHQERAAIYSGVDAARTIVKTMTLSGMVAGLTGAVFVIMTLSYYSNPAGIPTFGFDAIAVSLLGANNPLAVIPAGLLFGGLESGGNFISQSSPVPRQLIDGVIGLVILFVAAPELFRMAGRSFDLGGDEQ